MSHNYTKCRRFNDDENSLTSFNVAICCSSCRRVPAHAHGPTWIQPGGIVWPIQRLPKWRHTHPAEDAGTATATVGAGHDDHATEAEPHHAHRQAAGPRPHRHSQRERKQVQLSLQTAA